MGLSFLFKSWVEDISFHLVCGQKKLYQYQFNKLIFNYSYSPFLNLSFADLYQLQKYRSYWQQTVYDVMQKNMYWFVIKYQTGPQKKQLTNKLPNTFLKHTTIKIFLFYQFVYYLFNFINCFISIWLYHFKLFLLTMLRGGLVQTNHSYQYCKFLQRHQIQLDYIKTFYQYLESKSFQIIDNRLSPFNNAIQQNKKQNFFFFINKYGVQINYFEDRINSSIAFRKQFTKKRELLICIMKKKLSRQQAKVKTKQEGSGSLPNNKKNQTSKEKVSKAKQQTDVQLPRVEKLQELLTKIISFQDPLTHRKLINKFTISYLIGQLDKNKLQSIDKVYSMKSQGFNILQFTRFFLNAIEHSESETLYLAMGLVDLFKAIAENSNAIQRIKFIHLTDFICLNILSSQEDSNIAGSSSNSYSQNKLDMKLIPEHKVITPNYEIKPYMINPPRIYGNKDQTVYKLSLTNIKTDKNKHDSVVTCCAFSDQYKKIFSLDALAEAIYIYDVNCKLERKLKPLNLKVKKDVVLLAFAYSHRQERIGAVLKDFTLSFWDFNDNLQFQKVISTASSCQQYQTNIWYLQYFQSWITSDRTGIIYIWNLQTQKPQRRIQCRYKGKINDVSQISCLNLLAVAQQSRGSGKFGGTGTMKQIDEPKIILYNYFKGEEISEIVSINDMRIPHTLQYSQSYQVLLSAGLEKKINIFQINHKYLDTSLKGELHGHENLITHFTLVKKTPMVVSCDDKGKVKIWDLRNYKCVQTLDFRDKTLITRLLDMVEVGKFGVLGSRVNFLQYDQKQQIIKKYQSHERSIPLNINFIYQQYKLLITTKKDLRIYDIKTGGVERVYCEFHNKDEEIVIFKYYEFMKKLLITNEKGEIRLVSIKGGFVQGGAEGAENADGGVRDQQRLEGFTNGSVTHVEYDQQNKLFLTCGGNGTIKIHKLLLTLNPNNDPSLALLPSKQSSGNRKQPLPLQHISTKQSDHSDLKPYKTQQWTVIRQMRGNFHNKDMTAMSFSVYHGMIAIGSNCSEVYVWDYQYARLLFGITLPNGVEPTALSFINGFSILIIAASNGEVYLVKLLRQNQHQYHDKSHGQKKIGPDHLLSFKDNRQIELNPVNNTPQLSLQQDQSDSISEIIVDISMKGTINSCQTIQFAKIYMAYSSGKIAIMELSQMLKKQSMLPHRKKLPTYNPQRQLKQNFAVQIEKNKILMLTIKPLSQQHVSKRQFPYHYQFLKPHSGAITEMKILQFDRHYLITCGNQRIKLWGDLQQSTSSHSIISSMQLLGDFNINHPLPYLWSFTVNNDRKTRDKIMFSLKIIQSIFKKFGSDISTGQSKLLRLEKFFKSLSSDSRQKKAKQSFRDSLSYKFEDGFKYLTEPELTRQQQFGSSEETIQTMNLKQQGQPQRPYLFQQQYSKKDLHYDQIKKYNFYQIGGPSLRQLEFRKKMDTMQKQWQATRLKQQQQKTLMMNKILMKAQKNQQKEQIISFLQDRRFSTKRQTIQGRGNNGNSIMSAANYTHSFANVNTNNIVNAITGNHNKPTNNNNTNTNNNITTITTISPIDQEQSQFPVVKRIAEELQRVEVYQQQQHMREAMSNSGITGGLMKSYSQQFMGKYGNNTSSAIMMKSSPMQVSIIENTNEDKIDYGCMLRKYYHSSTKTSFNFNPKSSNPKGFEEYYFRKQPQRSHFQTGEQQQSFDGKGRNNYQLQGRMHKIATSVSKNNNGFRSISQQSLRSRNLNKVKSDEHISFQNILKDMNNRVLLSRQGRTVKRTNQQIDSEKAFEYPNQRQKPSRRLMKTTHYIGSGSYSRENKIN